MKLIKYIALVAGIWGIIFNALIGNWSACVWAAVATIWVINSLLEE